ncbi:MAG TPA: hypothetical protein VLD13_08840 [Gaiellaceae bacterium]|nr:hypothetical protein [Gaiellaceae bacterium]
MEPRLIMFTVIALAAAHWMVTAGVAKRVLTRRKPDRRCPSCGRLPRDCSCVR